MKKKKTDASIAETHILNKNILELKNITKTFLNGKIIANDNISISFKRNEVHAIVGENGSGKSTLMNIIFGLYKQDQGDIFVNGEKQDMYHPGAAKKHKIGMVHQHFHLVENFTILENVILGQENTNVDFKKINKYKEELKSLKNNISKEDKLIINKIKNSIKNLETQENNFIKYKNLLRENSKDINKINKNTSVKKISKLNKEKINLNLMFDKTKLDLEKAKLNYEKNSSGNYKKLFLKIKRIISINHKIEETKLSGFFGKLKIKNLVNRFRYIQKRYNINLDPYAKVSTLSVGQRQMVEILKVLWVEKEILVLDEPTATLSIIEIKELMNTINSLKKEGKTIIFISHKLKEVKEISDRISILRKGKIINTHLNNSKLKSAIISKEMVGRVVKFNYPIRNIKGKEILKVKNISYRTKKGFKALDNISFSVKKGEIFGLAGIEGNGQEEIIKIITDLKKPSNGFVEYKNQLLTDHKGYKLKGKHRRKIMSHIPIDRLKHGVVPELSLEFNSKITDFDTNFFKKKNNITPSIFTNKIINEFNVEGAFNNNIEIRNLSGGNQQKFVIGRELLRNHEILVAGHPTRGLDVSAIDHIYKNIIQNSKDKTTILYSLELSELIAVCDRMAIFYKGKIVSIIEPKSISISKISRMLIGDVS